MKSAVDILNSFTLENIPSLDIAVLGALSLAQNTELPSVPADHFKKPLVIGSGNAYQTGQILFQGSLACFASESDYEEVLSKNSDTDGVVIVSASGGKHAVSVAKTAKNKSLSTILLTNNSAPAASEYIDPKNIFVFPKNREPYTYNTSTYLSMVFSKTGESAGSIMSHIMNAVEPKLFRNLGAYGSFVFLLPARYKTVCPMVATKFDELFGPYVQGRVFTDEEVKHAKTVVTSGDELFISIGVNNEYYGLSKNRLSIPLPDDANFAAVIATCYYIVGAIQKEHPPFFKNNLVNYTEMASRMFSQEIKPIVE